MRHALPLRRLVGLLAAVALLATAGCGGTDGRTAAAGSCDDFATQADAQRAANTLDGDDDGRFCERLPCPCAGPGAPSDDGGAGAPAEGREPRAGGGERPAGPAYAAREAVVTRVIDGDTLDARLTDGTTQRVRLVGIDTPEKTALRSGRAECGGEEATRATEALARRWRDVTLRPDRTQDAFDRYDRLLAYVEPRADAGRSYQEELLAQGWAKVYVFGDTPFAEVSAFRDAARRAERARAGVWRRCGGEFRRPNDG